MSYNKKIAGLAIHLRNKKTLAHTIASLQALLFPFNFISTFFLKILHLASPFPNETSLTPLLKGHFQLILKNSYKIFHTKKVIEKE